MNDDQLIEAIFGKDTFKVGDRVVLPEWFSLTKRQERVNEILGIYPRRGYVFMNKVLQDGSVSTDRRAVVYFPYRNITSLRHLMKGK